MTDLATAAAVGDRFATAGLADEPARLRLTDLAADFASVDVFLGVPGEAPAPFATVEALLGVPAEAPGTFATRDFFLGVLREAPAFEEAAAGGTPAFLAAVGPAAVTPRACCKACIAASAFFRACFAAFLRCFHNFRACLSWALAARTSCFAACAPAAALFASEVDRCAATPFPAFAAIAREIATICPVEL